MHLNIVLGYKCNFFCSHCANNSGLKPSAPDISDKEIEMLSATINKHRPKHILFSGGEPSLYIDKINAILGKIHDLHNTRVSIVTNGSWAADEEKTKVFFESLLKVSDVTVSYDKFHRTKTSVNSLVNIKNYCLGKAIGLNVSMSISDMKQIAEAKQIMNDIDLPIQFQKVIKSGRALDNNLAFKYFSFDTEILSKKCPSEGRISFLPGNGFSTCCSSLVFNHKDNDYTHNTLEEHLNSEFYKDQSSKTFGELIRKFNIENYDNVPGNSLECGICEYIYKTK
ncbi:MAG: radical SAM protein [Pseudobdellovibrionaceae bacterium]|nr:MAG: radical SAM protein [Pseudobdellovibrionaceae bacterium]